MKNRIRICKVQGEDLSLKDFLKAQDIHSPSVISMSTNYFEVEHRNYIAS